MNANVMLNSFRNTNTIVPLIGRAIGSFPCLWLTYLNHFLEIIFSELMENNPIALIGHDSAGNSKNYRVALPGCEPRSAPPGLISIYTSYAVAALRERCAAVKGTKAFAEQLAKIPATDSSSNGCSQIPAFGKGIYLGSFQEVRDRWNTGILAPREAERISACRNLGLNVIQTDEIHVLRVVNSGGSTGESVEVLDAMASKAIAWDKGIRLKNHLIVLLPSCSNSVNESAMRQNAWKFLLEASLAVTSPEKIVLQTLDNKTIRYTQGPIYDSIIPLGVTSPFQAASNRDEMAARLAMLCLCFATTPFLAWSEEAFADVLNAQDNRQYGAPIFRRLGWMRNFCSKEFNREIMKDAALTQIYNLL